MLGKLDFPCPECGTMFKATLDDVAAHRTKRCPRGHAVRLTEARPGDARKVRDAERKLDKSVRDLERTLKRFGK